MKALEADVFHDRMGDTDAVERFNPSGTIGQNTDGPGWSNGRDRCIPPEKTLGFQLTALVGWEGAPFLCQSMRGFMSLLANKSHQLIRDVQRVIGIVRDPQLNQQISKSHDTEPNLSGAFGPGLDRGQRETGSLEHIIEKANRQLNDVFESFVVDAARASMGRQASGDIDRSERARFIGQKRLLAARVRGFDRPEVGCGICFIDGIKEEDTRLT